MEVESLIQSANLFPNDSLTNVPIVREHGVDSLLPVLLLATSRQRNTQCSTELFRRTPEFIPRTLVALNR
jgi:hypothetical protein